MPKTDTMLDQFERFENGAIIAALLARLGVDYVQLTRHELASLTFREVQRKDQPNGDIVFMVAK